jgi:hypothetical protein
LTGITTDQVSGISVTPVTILCSAQRVDRAGG